MAHAVSFASDNAAGIHPAILAAIERANQGHALGYGHDPWTARAIERVRAELGESAHPLLCLTGTGANALGLRAMVDSYQSVLCAETSHLWRDECAAPERFLGCKLVPIETEHGKLSVETVRPYLRGFGVVHHAQPRAISVAQPTEWGTLYSLDELRALADLAHEHDMVLHVDGARLCNAAAALDVPLGAFGADSGIDILCLGGTKLGLLAAEAVVLFDEQAARRAGFFRKQSMQLASKMRFVAVQIEALLCDELWRELAGNANVLARRLASGLESCRGVDIVRPVDTNAVFARLPPTAVEPLQHHAQFHVWDPAGPVARLMTAWDTTERDVDAFVDAARRVTEQ